MWPRHCSLSTPVRGVLILIRKYLFKEKISEYLESQSRKEIMLIKLTALIYLAL